MRLNAPSSVAPMVFEAVIGPLLAANPNLNLEIIATDRLVDIVGEGFDAGIRLGESLREGMTAVRIRPPVRFVVVGSPDYLAGRPAPQRPADLQDHVCIRNLFPSGAAYPWEFQKGDEITAFEPAGPLALDDHDLMVQAAVAGVGLAYVWEGRAAAELERGRLVSCLEPWCQDREWLHLYYPTRKYMSAGLRAVIAALRA